MWAVCNMQKLQDVFSDVHQERSYIGYTGDQQTHEKMLNIINYQRNANQNYSEVSFHNSQNDHCQKVYEK